jgi:hypothetical protein
MYRTFWKNKSAGCGTSIASPIPNDYFIVFRPRRQAFLHRIVIAGKDLHPNRQYNRPGTNPR